MTATSRRTVRASALVALVALGLTSCGADDQPATISKQQFIQQISALDNAKVDPGVASCVYDNVKKDKAVMADLAAHGADSDKISQESSDKLGRLLARCIRGAQGGSTTTTTTTTTTSES